MEKKYIKATVKNIQEDGLLSGIVGSTAAIDRYGEIVDQKSWILDNFKKNPVILWAHNLTLGDDKPPIGKAVNVEVKAGKLRFDIQFDMADPFAADIFRKYKEGFLNAFSVGFMPGRVEDIQDESHPELRAILKNNELLELSAVPVPANPEALQSLRAKSFKAKSWDRLIKETTKEEEQDDEELKTDSLVTKVVEKIAPHLEKKISDIVSKAIEKSPVENVGGAGKDSAPKNTLQGQERIAEVARRATKLLQEGLAEFNKSARG